MHCNFCGSITYDKIYKPKGTKREAMVCLCQQCGLCFTEYGNTFHNHTPTPSGDADWGNIRWAKESRLRALKPLLQKYIEGKPIEKLLDVGSSRGDFVLWVADHYPKIQITAVESDGRVVKEYQKDQRINLTVAKLEDMRLPENAFDFMYCCQSLEHTDSTSQILSIMSRLLKIGGRLFIEVPNMETLRAPHMVEEFFLDKHTFHFNTSILCRYLEWLGFQITETQAENDMLNIRILAMKVIDNPTRVPFLEYWGQDSGKLLYANNYTLLKDYEKNITQNRKYIPTIVDKIKDLRQRGMKVAFWGATAIFDLMVKYGGLDPQDVECLVDTYLYNKIPHHSGVVVQHPDYLRVYQPDVVINLGRFSAHQIDTGAKKYGVQRVVGFYELLESQKQR